MALILTKMDEHNCDTDDNKQLILDNIEKHGCHIVLLNPTNYLPGFAYSIGLYQKFSHPEIICFGLNQALLGAVINHACKLIKQGEILVPGKLYPEFLSNYDIQFLPVDIDYYQNYLGYGGWFYNSFDFPALQLVWPDKQSVFPWQNEFNPDWKFRQPLLDRNIDFKFYESENLGVYTTIQVLNGDPILYVYHNDDGDWQFHSSAEPDLNDVKLVCLKEITKIDTSVNQIYNLEYGSSAWRQSLQDDWEYAEGEENDDQQ